MTFFIASGPGAVGSGRPRLGPEGGPALQRPSETMEDFMRLARLTLPALLVLGLLAAPLAAEAPPAGKLPTIGFLGPLSPPAMSHWTDALV